MCWSRNGRPWFVTAAVGGARAARGARAGAIRGWVAAARLPGQRGRKWTTEGKMNGSASWIHVSDLSERVFTFAE